MEKIKIGNVEIEKTACLAPMASVADRAYRTICREFGASFVVSEMISSKGLFYNDKKTAELCTVTQAERPMALQIFGDEPEYIKRAVEIVQKYTPCIIDVNMGCPVPKVAGNGAGSALMKNPQLAGEIVKAAVSVSNVPVTVKIRSGWNSDSINAVEFSQLMEQCGAAAIAVHARTKTQMYSGNADWEIIKKVKQAVRIPVIGNGDVTTAVECAAMYERTGCDLVMLGRGSYGRPWVFKQIREYLSSGKVSIEPDLNERLEIMLHQVKMMVANKGEKGGILEARKIVAWYIKGSRNAAVFRNECGRLSTLDDLKLLIEKIKISAEVQ